MALDRSVTTTHLGDSHVTVTGTAPRRMVMRFTPGLELFPPSSGSILVPTGDSHVTVTGLWKSPGRERGRRRARSAPFVSRGGRVDVRLGELADDRPAA